MANVYHPSTIDVSFNHGGQKPVGGLKTDSNEWNTDGHRDRMIAVGEEQLGLFAQLYDAPGTPALAARLPAVHSLQVVDVLRKFVKHPRRLGDLRTNYVSTEMWHETNAQKDGTIRRETQFPNEVSEWILSGPHFYVGTPFNKTPDKVCTKHHQYSCIDLTIMPDDYLPRTNYVPDCSPAEYRKRTPDVAWAEKAKVTDYYRLAYRGMLSQSGERTLIGCILPKSCGHINGAQATVFRNHSELVAAAIFSSSLVADFFVKTTGRTNLHYIWEAFPVLPFAPSASTRLLLLMALTTYYADFWQECWQATWREDNWTKDDPRLPRDRFTKLTPSWTRDCSLRTDYERRQSLVEIDALVAMALGLALDELCTIYRIQFPVLRQNENDTWYDQNGRIVFTCSKGLPGVGLTRKQWVEAKDMKKGKVVVTIDDDTMPGGPNQRQISYIAPFDRCDREADYATAWKAFVERGITL